jgi:hypothetical protein
MVSVTICTRCISIDGKDERLYLWHFPRLYPQTPIFTLCLLFQCDYCQHASDNTGRWHRTAIGVRSASSPEAPC